MNDLCEMMLTLAAEQVSANVFELSDLLFNSLI